MFACISEAREPATTGPLMCFQCGEKLNQTNLSTLASYGTKPYFVTDNQSEMKGKKTALATNTESISGSNGFMLLYSKLTLLPGHNRGEKCLPTHGLIHTMTQG